jgi:di/tricarboxylate transporter
MSIFLTIGVLVVALICFIFEWFPVDFTAICVTITLMVLGIVTPEEGISGFSNSATITVMAMFILSAGISRTGAIASLRNLLLKYGGKNTSQQILTLSLIVGPVSAFINNTAVVAIFLPIIEDWCKKTGISISKLLIPLSYATILGGMLTLIGTSTNILASGIVKQMGYREFELFEFTRLGILTFIIGIIYLAVITPLTLPDRKSSQQESITDNYDLKDYITEVLITPRSSLINKTLRETELQRKFDIDVLEVIRNDIHFAQPLGDKILNAGDILLVRSNRDELLKIREEKGLELLADVKFENKNVESELNTGQEKIAEVLILSNSRLIGSTLKDLRFRQRYNATVIAIKRGQELIRQRLGRVSLRFGDLLLVQAPKESFLGLQTTRELLVLEERNVENLRQDKAIIAVSIVFAVVLVAALTPFPILVTSLVGVTLMVFTGCLKPGEIYGAVRWDVIFLLAGLIPLGIAMDKSGTTQWLADNLLSLGGELSGYWILLFFFIITSFLTEILSNNASVVLMIPIAVKVAVALNLNPYSFMYAVTFAASNSFATPIGYQTNTMVYSAGGYKFLDFIRIGGPLNLLMIIVIPLLIVWLYPL